MTETIHIVKSVESLEENIKALSVRDKWATDEKFGVDILHLAINAIYTLGMQLQAKNMGITEGVRYTDDRVDLIPLISPSQWRGVSPQLVSKYGWEVGYESSVDLVHDLLLESAISNLCDGGFKRNANFIDTVVNRLKRQLRNRSQKERMLEIKGSASGQITMHKKQGRSFRVCNAAGAYHIDGYRYGPRDGIILQLSSGGEFFETSAVLFANGPMNKCDIRRNVAQELLESANTIYSGNFLKNIKAFKLAKSEKESASQARQDNAIDIKKAVPEFGKWGAL